MTTLVLWLFGVLTLASLIMVASWGRAAWGLYPEAEAAGRRWHRPFVIAASMALHAGGMALGCGYRTFDMLAGVPVIGSDIAWMTAIMLMISASKVGLVWGIAIDTDARRARWPWWAFLYAMAVWGVFVAFYGGGKITF